LLASTAALQNNSQITHRYALFVEMASSALYYAELCPLDRNTKTQIVRQLVAQGHHQNIHSSKRMYNIGHKVWLLLARLGLGCLAFCDAKTPDQIRRLPEASFLELVDLLEQGLDQDFKIQLSNFTFPNIPPLQPLFNRLAFHLTPTEQMQE
jgi:hypothetical protein